VGAQAIYLHTGDVDLGVAEYTTDADLALDPDLLAEIPPLEQALESAGFFGSSSAILSRHYIRAQRIASASSGACPAHSMATSGPVSQPGESSISWKHGCPGACGQAGISLSPAVTTQVSGSGLATRQRPPAADTNT
jgi:hypothetical protein